MLKKIGLFLSLFTVIFIPTIIPGNRLIDSAYSLSDTSTQVRIADIYASSPKERTEARKAADGNLGTRWSSDPTDMEWITFVLGRETAVGKVVIYWEAAFGETYQIQVSENGRDWYVAYNAVKHKGGKEEITFKPVLTKYLRIFGISRGTQWGYSIFECEIYSSEAEALPVTKLPRSEDVKYKKSDMSPSAYCYRSAERSPAGYFPEWLSRRQVYWTITGAPYNTHETLLSEYGMVDSCAGGFSLMPYLYIDGDLVTAKDVDFVAQDMEKGYLPIPSVTWRYRGLQFVQKLFSYGTEKESHSCVLYTLQNGGEKQVRGKLFLTIRPFQVNPPWMYGGFSKIGEIKRKGFCIEINGRTGLLALEKSFRFGAASFDEGDIIDAIGAGKVPLKQEVRDISGFASAVLEYDFKLPPNRKNEYMFLIPLNEVAEPLKVQSHGELLSVLGQNAKFWENELNKIEIDIPDKLMRDTFRANIAYIMINYDSSAFVTGPRNYERAWLRDGSEMAVAMLRAGQSGMVEKYIRWLVSFQKADGEIPCIMESNGKPRGEREYDNQGEFLFCVAEYCRFVRSKEFLREIYPAVIKAAKFIELLRNRRLTREYENTRFYGILPLSISHEGFPDPGAHSYYDDWFALKGLKDVQYLARELGKTEDILWANKLENDLRSSLSKSIQLTMKEKNIRFVPSSAEGHQDACGNSISVWPAEDASHLPGGLIEAHMDDWYANVFLPERKKQIRNNFTPYEMRMAHAYLLLGRKKEALEMLRFFLSVVRPGNWKHWAECVAKNPREAVYLGDMPHGWVGAMYINLFRSLFVYEKNNLLILGAGIDEKWLERKEGVSVKNMPTYFGTVNYSMKMSGNLLKIIVEGSAKPPRGFVIKSPIDGKDIQSVSVNKKSREHFSSKEIECDSLPVELEVSY